MQVDYKGQVDESPESAVAASIDGVTLNYLPPVEVDLTIKVDRAMIDINQSPAPLTLSFNSDKREAKFCPAGALMFAPAGCEMYIKSNNSVPGLFLTLNNDALDSWLAPARVGENYQDCLEYKRDTVAGYLAQAAVEELDVAERGGRAPDVLTLEALLVGFSSRFIKRVSEETNPDLIKPFAYRCKNSDEKIIRAKEYIRDNLCNPSLKVADVASSIGWSTQHFSSSFKTAAGFSPYKFILSERVEFARRMLVGTSTSIAEIAYMTGYADQSHMTSTFSKVLGLSPAKVRQLR